MILEVGCNAPNFNLPTDENEKLSLSSLRGKNIVLYFYPKDMTPGCTKEAEDFRNFHDQFLAANAVIVGVSKDSVRRHCNFKTKYKLPFSLIADEEVSICKDYGVWVEKKNYGRVYMGIERATFLINQRGEIIKFWRKVRVKGHVEEVLSYLKKNMKS